MPNLDETELARLERLKEDSDNSRKIYGGDTPATVWYQLETANAVPALIAEIRRLRRNYECSEKPLQRHEHMVAELMEKVEAWEWCNQVQHIYDNIAFVLGLRQCAIDELYATLTAAREAVHADRE